MTNILIEHTIFDYATIIYIIFIIFIMLIIFTFYITFINITYIQWSSMTFCIIFISIYQVFFRSFAKIFLSTRIICKASIIVMIPTCTFFSRNGDTWYFVHWAYFLPDFRCIKYIISIFSVHSFNIYTFINQFYQFIDILCTA